ncbi:MAG: hypothetical protein ACOYNF_03470 [Rhodoferax sp.]
MALNKKPIDIERAIAPIVATPENTPVPGGGRWCWSDALPGWVEVTEEPAVKPEPATIETTLE